MRQSQNNRMTQTGIPIHALTLIIMVRLNT